MISKSKPDVSFAQAAKWLKRDLGETLETMTPLGEGEYNAVLRCQTESGRSVVLKVAPKPDCPVLTYERNMMSSELHWYETIQRQTDIPTPKILASSSKGDPSGLAYFLMEDLKGEPADRRPRSDAETHSILLQKTAAMASMHRIKGSGYGYVQHGLKETWFLAIESMIADLLEDATKKNKPSKRGMRLLQVVRDSKELLETVECRMVNFDLWDSNWLVTNQDSKAKPALIDPERCFYGDFIGDFVAFEFLKPLAKKTQTLESYRAQGGLVFDLGDDTILRYAILTGYLALIMEVEKHYRYKPGMAGWTRNVVVSRLLYSQAFSMIRTTSKSRQ